MKLKETTMIYEIKLTVFNLKIYMQWNSLLLTIQTVVKFIAWKSFSLLLSNTRCTLLKIKKASIKKAIMQLVVKHFIKKYVITFSIHTFNGVDKIVKVLFMQIEWLGALIEAYLDRYLRLNIINEMEEK